MNMSHSSVWLTSQDSSKDHTVLVSKEEIPGVWIVSMNQPEQHNMLTPLMMGALAREIDRLSVKGPEEIAAIILTSAGKSFCAGIDINAIRDNPDFEEHMTRDVDPFYALQECQVPVVCCVNGPAMTGGFELALSCDIVIACRDAVFRDNHAMYGVHAIRGLSQLLPRLCGPSSAKMISLASVPISGEKALQLNIISELVDTVDDLVPAAMRIVKGIVYNNGPIIRKLKQTMQTGFELSYDAARKLELQSDIEYYDSLGDTLPEVLARGAKRFNQRVKELGTVGGMKGGSQGPVEEHI